MKRLLFFAVLFIISMDISAQPQVTATQWVDHTCPRCVSNCPGPLSIRFIVENPACNRWVSGWDVLPAPLAPSTVPYDFSHPIFSGRPIGFDLVVGAELSYPGGVPFTIGQSACPPPLNPAGSTVSGVTCQIGAYWNAGGGIPDVYIDR